MRAILARKRHRQPSRRRKLVRQRFSFSRLLLLGLFCGVGWLGYRYVRSALTPPQAVLVLGGAAEREQYAAKFAQKHPELPIWISSGAPREYSEWVFAKAGVNLERLKLDYRAVDTLTNFTTLVDDLKDNRVSKVYLITSDYHMRRSRLIGQIVLGSRGIDFQTVTIPSKRSEEHVSKTLRDGGRAVFWLMTGYTGYEKNAFPQAGPSN